MELENRELQTLWEYWDGRRNGRSMPSRADIDPIDLRSLLPNLFLVDVEEQPRRRFRYRLVGTELTTVMGAELKGKYVDEMSFLFRKYAESAYGEVIALRAPVYRQINTIEAFRRVRYHRLLLPLSTDDAAVHMVLGAIYRF